MNTQGTACVGEITMAPCDPSAGACNATLGCPDIRASAFCLGDWVGNLLGYFLLFFRVLPHIKKANPFFFGAKVFSP